MAVISFEHMTAVGHGLKLASRVKAFIRTVIAFDHKPWVDAHADLMHGLLKCLLANSGGVQTKRAGDKGDPLMPQCRQVLDCLSNAASVVNFDVADPGNCRRHIYKDQWHFSKSQVLEQRVFHAESEDRHTLHSAFDHAPHRKLHALWIMHGGSEQNFVIMLHRDVFERLDDLREKRVGDFGNNQPKDAGPARDQCASLSIRLVPKFFHHFPNSLGKLRIHRWNAINSS
jgi:hypothetical protein